MSYRPSKTTSSLLPLLVLVILVSGLVIGLTLLKKAQTYKADAATANAVLTLTPSRTNILPNDTITVQIGLNPANQPVVGVDFIVNFNKSVFTLNNIQTNSGAGSGFKTFLPLVPNTNNFDEVTVRNSANSTGNIKFGAAAFDLSNNTVESVSTAANNIATLTFIAKTTAPTGISPISFQYTATRNTTDTNVVITNSNSTTLPEDILAAPLATNINIQAPATTPTPTTCVPIPTPTNTSQTVGANGLVTFNWSPVSVATGYWVYIVDSINGSPNRNVCNPLLPGDYCTYPNVLPSSPTSFSRTLVPGHTYHWSVSAAGGCSGGSIPTAYVTFTVPGTPNRKPGDTEPDGDVDLVDYNIWANNYKKVVIGGPSVGNFNNSVDNLIDLLDYNLWVTNYNR